MDTDPTHFSAPPETVFVPTAPPPPEQGSKVPEQPILAGQLPQEDILPARQQPPPPPRCCDHRPYPQSHVIDVGDLWFDDRHVRQAFIRKVYSILMAQLLVSLAVVALFTFNRPIKLFVLRYLWLYLVAIGIAFVTSIAIACFGSLRRKFPLNFIFLAVFTAAMSFALGTIASTFEGDAVMMAVGLTAAVSLGLTLFAFQTKWDFTVLRGGLLVFLIVLFVFGIVVSIFPSKVLILVYASLGAILFSLYLVVDTQMIVGGKHRYSISPEEYIFAALNLYLDIIYLFLYILPIISAVRK